MRSAVRAVLLASLTGCEVVPWLEPDASGDGEAGPDLDLPTGPEGCVGPAADPLRASCVVTTSSVAVRSLYVDVYDACGRIVQRTNTSQHDRRTFYAYDRAGRLAWEEHPELGRVDVYDYGFAGRIEAVDHWKDDRIDAVETWTYDGPDPLAATRWQWDDGRKTGWESYQHDARGRVAWVAVGQDGVVRSLEHRSWDGEDRLIGTYEREDLWSRTRTFTWEADRLVASTVDSSVVGSGPDTTYYRYDELGRLVAEDVYEEDRDLFGGSQRYAWACEDPDADGS